MDLDQKTLPGIAHQVVEQMIISDQIKAEDRANVLRALLLKHRYIYVYYVYLHFHLNRLTHEDSNESEPIVHNIMYTSRWFSDINTVLTVPLCSMLKMTCTVCLNEAIV